MTNPTILPTAAIYADPIPVCRELRTKAGPLDCLFVTRFGGLVLVDYKLWRNPQARQEIAGQVIDYAKKFAGWGYVDPQREIYVARGERGTNALFDLVAARHPGTDEAAFVDAVACNLARGRLMLLLAGDDIREGMESIVQHVLNIANPCVRRRHGSARRIAAGLRYDGPFARVASYVDPEA